MWIDQSLLLPVPFGTCSWGCPRCFPLVDHGIFRNLLLFHLFLLGLGWWSFRWLRLGIPFHMESFSPGGDLHPGLKHQFDPPCSPFGCASRSPIWSLVQSHPFRFRHWFFRWLLGFSWSPVLIVWPLTVFCVANLSVDCFGHLWNSCVSQWTRKKMGFTYLP